MSSGGPVCITGVGSSELGWRLEQPLRVLVVDACRAALRDAGITVHDVDAIVIESSYAMSASPPDRIAQELGINHSFRSVGSGIGGAGVVGSLGIAELLIRHGGARHVLCYFGADFGSDPGGPYAFPVGMETKRGYEAPHGWFGQPLYFAAMAQRYDDEFGLPEDSLASVALAARHAALRSETAVLRKPLDRLSYGLEPRIAGPLRRADCSVITDGAAAWVVSRSDVALDTPHVRVGVLGVGHSSEPGQSSDSYFSQRASFTSTPCTSSAASAFASAGVTPLDIDVAEIYDCFTISTIIQLEDSGFCDKGDGAAFVASGAIELGGSLPTNTHGGLLAHSYTVGAHHLVEATLQLRGEEGHRQVDGAEVAFVAGLGLPEHASAVLARL